jgi:hypothetical protein
MADHSSPNALRRCPPEIRDIIYAHALEEPENIFTNQRPTPVLLVTLRCEEDLYKEALEIYYKVNFFCLDGRTFKSFDRLDISILKLLKKMDIYVEYVLNLQSFLLKLYSVFSS